MLKTLRLERGWTHDEAAERMGISRGQFIKLERGERGLTERTIGLAAKAFHVSKAKIIDEPQAIGDDDELTNTRDLQSMNRIQPGILELDIRAGMGGGGFPTHEIRERGEYRDAMKSEAWHFPTWFLRQELRASADKLIVVETQGDSMLPTIAPGEPVVVNIAHLLPTPDGIYAMRDRWGTVIVKRLQVLRKGDPPRVLIISDNKAHSDEEVGADEIDIVGRVLCSLRRL